MRELKWAPYQEFGIPDPEQESFEAPSGAILIGSVGCRGEDIIVYWYRPKTMTGEQAAKVRDSILRSVYEVEKRGGYG